MRIKRIRAYIIDFLILTLILFIINTFLPLDKKTSALQEDKRSIASSYYKGDLTYGEYIEVYGRINYKIDKNMVVNNIAYLVFMIIYFIVVPILYHGRTIGARFNNIQIESFSDSNLKFYQIIIRALLITGLGYVFMKNLLVFILNENTYFIGITICSLIQVIILGISLFMMIREKDKRGLHEILSNTEMVKITEKHMKNNK